MRFEQLECLLAVEETGSFVGAAQKLFLTQQAVSMSMKQLEQELGQTILVRENKKNCLYSLWRRSGRICAQYFKPTGCIFGKST